MRIHFASAPARVHIKVLNDAKAENLLFSFAFIKNPVKLAELLSASQPKRIILDSGAFSVWSKGDTIDIDAYADFALKFQALIDPSIKLFIVNLDVLPGKWGYVPSNEQIAESAEQGWKNMLYLESKGLKVIHIFHQHEDFAILDKLRAHSDYIGISPANDVSMDEKKLWLDKCFAYLWDDISKKGLKTHGFAVTSHKQVFGYPFYSVDSSSWVMAARFGRIPVMTDKWEIKSLAYKDKEQVEKYWPYLVSIGIDRLADNLSWHDRVLISIKAYQKLQEIATQLWTTRGVTFE